jgi:hypothetical protein
MRQVLVVAVLLAMACVVCGSGLAAADGAGTDPNNPTPLVADVQGTLPAGGFNYYAFLYPGDGSIVAFTMMYSPTDAIHDPQIGFNLYAPDARLAAQGSPGGNPLGFKIAQYTSSIAGRFELQLSNYGDRAISYHVTTTGLPATSAPLPTVAAAAHPSPAPLPTPIPLPGTVSSSADQPLPLANAQNVVLSGNNGGSFNYYTLHAASALTTTLTMHVAPDIEAFNQTAGFKVYSGGTLLASSAVSQTPPWAAVATFSLPAGADALIVVGNYDQFRSIVYSITQT